MPTPNNAWLNSTWRHDLLASIVVFLVALPLCMGIAIASGVPADKAAAVGIITGIVGGILVGSLAGSPLLISGPAAGLSVLMFDLVQKFGWEQIGLIVLMAGACQMAAGWFKLGQWFRAVSPAVIHGMLAGIGVLIFASQFHIMLDDAPRGSGWENILALPEAIYRGLVPSDGSNHAAAARIGTLTIVLLILWKALAPKRLKVIPAPLVAVVVATVVTVSLGLSINQVALPERLLSAVTLPSLPSASLLANWQSLLIAVVSIAFIASAETLLSASAVDQMHTGPRTNYDRELLAQGVGNLTCGFLGALPVTGVIVRSATNVDAGARSSKSEILHSVWLLVFVCIFPFVLRWIPTASLAAILVYTGCKLVDLKTVREKLLPFGKSEVAIYVATMVLIVATDLLTGVLIGMALSIIKLVVTFSHLNIRADDHPQNRRTVLYLEGTATFLRLPKLAAALDAVPLDRELHVHFERLEYIDHACLDLLMARQKQLGATGGGLVIDWESLTARFHDYGKNHRRNGPGPASPANGQENGKRTNQDGGNSRTREESQHAV